MFNFTSVLLAILISQLDGAESNKAIKTFRYPSSGGFDACEVDYDSRKYPEEIIKNGAFLARSVAGTSHLNSLQLCNIRLNPKYKPCGNHEYGSPNFLYNAGVNQDENNGKISKIKTMQIPRELKAIREKVLKDLEFSYWRMQQMYDFFKTRKLNILVNAKFKNLDISICRKKLEAANLKSATDSHLFEAVFYNWSNCINRLRQTVTERQATEAWNKVILRERCNIHNEDRN